MIDATLRRSPTRILDFGGGVANSVTHFRKYLPNAAVTCLDVSFESLRVGKTRYPSGVTFVDFDGSRIPFAEGSFDCVFAGCVFHYIDHEVHLSLFKEIRRVMIVRGLFMVYEHNPYNPLTLRAVRTSPFDENAKLIRAPAVAQALSEAGFAPTAYQYRVFFPHALAFLRGLEKHLAWLPLGAQYFVYCRAQ